MVFKDKSIVPPGDQGDYFSGNAAMTINQISRVSPMPRRPASSGASHRCRPAPPAPRR